MKTVNMEVSPTYLRVSNNIKKDAELFFLTSPFATMSALQHRAQHM